MARYIELEKAIKAFEIADADVCANYGADYGCEFGFSRDTIRRELERLPAVNVEPMRRGRIIEHRGTGRSKRKFSCCDTDCTTMTQWMWPKYCPYCGAKLNGEYEIATN